MKRRPSILLLLKIVCMLTLCVSLASVSFAFKEEATNALTPPAATTAAKSDSLQKVDIDRFTNAISQIKDYYVQPINDRKLLEDAIRGMLNGLDPHSEYLD